MAIKRIFSNPIFTFIKKHNCPSCEEVLVPIKVSKTVNASSPEASEYDFDNGENHMMGDVKFIWDEFKCPKCGFQVSARDLRKFEKRSKEQ